MENKEKKHDKSGKGTSKGDKQSQNRKSKKI